ncbi:immunoglobulin superfamily member 2-like [Poecilia formosa]|uniref:immunoglobulin superfamily member 2-like n=1 Tax=Poecilia formosa TaxID=48698 RepID=UPI0004442567|nr:PREDICTED: immunoglobulin superfamily member 2-like [Poecilia formosa]
MDVFLSGSLLGALVVCVVFADQRNITAKPGENVTLPCGAAENQHVLVVNWRRTDLGSEYILLYRDGQFDPEYQSPSFKDRVDLKAVDHGDLSLILSNMMINDTGTYECRVVSKDGNEKRATPSKELISTINLIVELGNKDGGQDEAKAAGRNKTGLIAVGFLVVAFIAIAIFVVVAVFKRCKRQTSLRPDASPPAEEVEQNYEDVSMHPNL